MDGILFWVKDEANISKLTLALCAEGLLLEQDDDAASFLGVHLTKTKYGHNKIKQTGLIDCIIETLGMDTCLSTSKWTPDEAKLLVQNENGEPPRGDFSYSSVFEMMLYLSGYTCPDITYVVSCCARYMFNPRFSHDVALKCIGCYLKAT